MSLKTSNVCYDLRLQADKDQLLLSHKTVAPVDKNTKLTLSIQEDSLAWFSNRAAAFNAFKVGFAVEYKV
jgi:hypothetical protein